MIMVFYAYIAQTFIIMEICLLPCLCTFKFDSLSNIYGSIFGKRYLLAIDHIMFALFWSYVSNMK